MGLPTAWPLGVYPGFTTGGVFAGNVNLEMLKFDASAGDLPQTRPVTFIYGIVFEPYPLEQAIDELRQRGADPGAPQDQMREMNGVPVKMWTNVTLQSICTDSMIVYLCEYAPEMKAASAGRNRSAAAVSAGIGLIGLSEIGIVSSQPGQTGAMWKRIFAPAPLSADGILTFETGPAVRISRGDGDRIDSLVFQVASLRAARDFLFGAGLLGETSANEITIDPGAVQGLNLRLVET
jgi:hypothetical protein